MRANTYPIGRVLRSTTTEFFIGCHVLEPDTPNFGEFVKVSAANGITIIGLIYNVQIHDDPAVRQLILAQQLTRETILDQRENRLVPIEVSVLIVGYHKNKQFRQTFPPQPPISLEEMQSCTPDEIVGFTKRLDYLRTVFSASQVPADQLIIASLTRSAESQATEVRRNFLLESGREIARVLNTDLVRLDGILRQLSLIVQEVTES